MKTHLEMPWLEAPWAQFNQRLEQQRMAHAVLIAGPVGIGKGHLALRMSDRLLCLQPTGQGACGECRSCHLLRGGAHPDRFMLEPEEGKAAILVDQVRGFTGQLALTATISPRKVAVIKPAEGMNVNAANALLKNLEEPQGDTVIILVSHDQSRLPVTIRSRCQAIAVRPPTTQDSLDWLAQQGQAGGDQARQALAAANGSPLQAAELLETGSVGEFGKLQEQLAGLIGRAGAVSAVTHGLGGTDPGQLWNWLSISAASALRSHYAGEAPGWLQGRRPADSRSLASLQMLADRNRSLAGTAVRQDLLLQEWLLEWARQTGDVT